MSLLLERGVVGDGENPGPELPFGAIATELREHLGEGHLCQVFRALAIPSLRPAARVPAHHLQPLQGRSVPAVHRFWCGRSQIVILSFEPPTGDLLGLKRR